MPIATADRYARQGQVQVAALPFPPPVFAVQQNWHARSHDEPRMRWPRSEIAGLFNDQTDCWKAIEVTLYGNLRGRHAGRSIALAKRAGQ